MCKAHVIRFACSHGLLMSLEFCSKTPCPLLKSTSKSLPQQPGRCYSCEKKRNEPNTSSSCASSYTSSSSRASYAGSITSEDSPNLFSPLTTPSVPKPMARNPRAGDYVMRSSLQCYGGNNYVKTFSFACSSDHAPPPQYDSLPAFLPHQNHDCPSCQFEAVRARSDSSITADAEGSWLLVRDDRQKKRRPERDWKESLGALDRYVEERRQEEKEMLYMVTRKWEQDLRAMRVMCDGDGGTSLMG